MASEMDWEVRELLWAMVPKAHEEILGWEETEWQSSIVYLAEQNGGEYGVGEWDEETLGRRGVLGVDTTIGLVLYEAVLIPELDGRRDGVVLNQCAEFLEKVLNDYAGSDFGDWVEYWVADISGYFQGNSGAWAVFREFAGPSFVALMKGEGVR